MRISDWSSDVCSSDLALLSARRLLEVRRLRPYDRLAITARKEEQTLTRGRCAVVGRNQHAVLANVTTAAQDRQESRPRLPSALRVGDEKLLLYRHTLTARRDRR